MKMCRVPISQLTTFKNQGSVEQVCFISSLEQLSSFVQTGARFVVLGKGSNSVIDPLSKAVFLKFSDALLGCHYDGDYLVAYAGCSVSRLLRCCVTHGITGFDFMAGVPASVGGMVFMNFGCWGHVISDLIFQVQYMDEKGDLHWVSPDVLLFDYRTSLFHSRPWIITAVKFFCSFGSSHDVRQALSKRLSERLAHQPLRARTFGSVFKNGLGYKVAKLIDELGFKAQMYGSVKVSDKHANFMENCGDAAFEDVCSYVQMIQDKVKTHFGIDLQPEVQFLS